MDLGFGKCLDVGIVNQFLLVCQDLEVFKDLLHLFVREIIPQILNSLPQGMPAAVLAQNEFGAQHSHILGVHDLIGGAFLEHAVLVNARFVSKGVLADNRLVALHLHASHV